MLTQKRLKELLHYDPGTGLFTWRVDCGTARAGNEAGHIRDHAYCEIQIEGVSYKAHRLAWLYEYGKWPLTCIDHDNRDKSDNRIGNLQETTNNNKNHPIHKSNTSGCMGVYYRYTKRDGVKMYEVSIHVDKKLKYFGVHRYHKAIAIRKALENLYGYHPNHGK